MQDIQIDFTQAKEGKASAPKLAPGNYIGTVTGITKKLNEKTGTIQIAFKINVDGNSYFTRQFNVNGKDSNFYLLEALNKLEVKVGDKESLNTLDVNGIKAEFSVTEREFNEKKYLDVDIVKGLGKSEVPF